MWSSNTNHQCFSRNTHINRLPSTGCRSPFQRTGHPWSSPHMGELRDMKMHGGSSATKISRLRVLRISRRVSMTNTSSITNCTLIACIRALGVINRVNPDGVSSGWVLPWEKRERSWCNVKEFMSGSLETHRGVRVPLSRTKDVSHGCVRI